MLSKTDGEMWGVDGTLLIPSPLPLTFVYGRKKKKNYLLTPLQKHLLSPQTQDETCYHSTKVRMQSSAVQF